MLRLFRQFSTPGGIPSHVSAPTPGSIHEGGELGYALVHAFGAAFDNPDLIVACVIGDGEAETGPLEGSWKGVQLPQPEPRRRGAADPPPERLQDQRPDRARPHERRGRARLAARRTATTRSSSRATIRRRCTSSSRRRSTTRTRRSARSRRRRSRRRRGPAGLRSCCARPRDGPAPTSSTACRSQGTFRVASGAALERARQRRAPRDARGMDAQLRARRPLRRERHVPRRAEGARSAGRQRAWARTRTRTGARCCVPLDIPDVRGVRRRRSQARQPCARSRRAQLGEMMRDIYVRNPTSFRLFCPDETNSNRLGAVFEVENRCHDGSDQPVRRPPVARRARHGGAERAQLRGLARGLRAQRPPRPLRDLRGVRDGAGVDGRAAREVARRVPAPRLARAGAVTERAADVDLLAQRPQRVQPPGSGLHRHDAVDAGRRRPRVPAARRELPALGRRPLLPQLRLRQPASSSTSSRSCSGSISTRRSEHCARGASTYGTWASTDEAETDPDVVLACAGDVPTLETIAAAWLIRQFAPDLKVRVVNVVDLTVLFPKKTHPHGLER